MKNIQRLFSLYFRIPATEKFFSIDELQMRNRKIENSIDFRRKIERTNCELMQKYPTSWVLMKIRRHSN